MVIWSFCSFSFFLIPYYLDTIPGNLFLMSSATAVAEILSSLICLFITHNIEIRKSIAFFCLVSCSATIAIILLTLLLKSNSQIPETLGYLVQYTGFVTTFDLVYVIVNELFPTIYLATAYGACNIVGRAVAISSPLVARVQQPWPMVILAIYSAICSVLPFLLIKIKVSNSSKS